MAMSSIELNQASQLPPEESKEAEQINTFSEIETMNMSEPQKQAALQFAAALAVLGKTK